MFAKTGYETPYPDLLLCHEGFPCAHAQLSLFCMCMYEFLLHCSCSQMLKTGWHTAGCLSRCFRGLSTLKDRHVSHHVQNKGAS